MMGFQNISILLRFSPLVHKSFRINEENTGNSAHVQTKFNSTTM